MPATHERPVRLGPTAGGDPHPSSYLVTGAAAATRAADQLTIPLGAFPCNTREDTLLAAGTLDRLPPTSAEDDRQHVLELFAADNESRWFFREDGLASSASASPVPTTAWSSRA